MSRKFACLYLAVALLVSSIWIASADERDTVQQEVQYSAAVEALDAAGLTSRSSNVLPSGEGLALALELGLPEEETISLERLLQEPFLSCPEQYVARLLPPGSPLLEVTASDDAAILSMVAAGLGVSVLSSFSLAGYEGQVQVLPLSEPLPCTISAGSE